MKDCYYQGAADEGGDDAGGCAAGFGENGGEEDAEKTGVGEAHDSQREFDESFAGALLPEDADACECAEDDAPADDSPAADFEILHIGLCRAGFFVDIVNEGGGHGVDCGIAGAKAGGEEACHHEP